MMPEQFGPFLIEQRKKKELTQKELARKIGVSTAAVSKWERGLCLPELSRFEDIAKAFNLNLVEVMQCREGSASSEEYAGTLKETIRISEKQHKQKLRKIIVLLAFASAICICLYLFPIYHILQVWSPSYFETGEISKLAYIGSQEDQDRARLFIAHADKAFSDLTTPEEQLVEKYGMLSVYAPGAEAGGSSETHSLKLWSAHFEDSPIDGYGYVWVYYSNEVKNEKNEVVQGSYKIPALWLFEKNDEGNWEIVSIKEHP